MMKKLAYSAFFTILASALFLASCGSDELPNDANAKVKVKDYAANVAVQWNDVFLEVERYQSGYRPSSAVRALAYLGISAYEACSPGFDTNASVATYFSELQLPAPDANKVYHWPTVVTASYEYLLPLFFDQASTEHQQLIADKAAQLYDFYKGETSPEIFSRSKDRGKAVAIAVWNWAKSDPIGHQFWHDNTQGYNWEDHYDGPGDWVPTDGASDKPNGGAYSQARKFILTAGDMLCRAPIPYSEVVNSDYYKAVLKVYIDGSTADSYENEWVSEFWSDDVVGMTFSPGSRWIAIGNQVLIQEKSNLEIALLMNAKVGVGLAESNIACWYSKYYYNTERPITYINKFINADWEPNLYDPFININVTPPFPAYPSGHATMAGAASELLSTIFGYGYDMWDRCHEGRIEFEGKPREFGSFYEMADENGYSRVPLGVHIAKDSEEGLRFGREIGRKVESRIKWLK